MRKVPEERLVTEPKYLHFCAKFKRNFKKHRDCRNSESGQELECTKE